MKHHHILIFALLIGSPSSLFSSEPPQHGHLHHSEEYVLQLEEFEVIPLDDLTVTQHAIVEQFGKPVVYAPWRADYVKKNSSTQKPPEGCAFCRQLGEFHDEKNLILRVFENGTVVKFNDYPYIPGQLLILPSKHTKGINDLSLEERGEIIELIPASIYLLQEKLGATFTTGGINIERVAGASIPDHLHIHLMPLFGNGLKNHVKDYTKHTFNPPSLQELYAKLKPSFNTLSLPKHTQQIPRSLTPPSPFNKTTMIDHKCALCMMLIQKNDDDHLILRRFKHHAVLFKPFADIEGQLLIVPIEHIPTTAGYTMTFQARSEFIELIWPLIEIIKTTMKADGCNVGFNTESCANAQASTHQHTEILPRFNVEMIGWTQKLAKIELMAKNLHDLYTVMKPEVDKIILPEHQEELTKEEQN